jgi:hypothetical protein
MSVSLTAAGATGRGGSAEFLCVCSAFCGACGGEAWLEVCNPTSMDLNNSAPYFQKVGLEERAPISN